MAVATTDKLTKLKHLQMLAERIKSDYTLQTDFDALSTKVDGLVTAGGEPNVIETVKVNGTALTVTDKAVDVEIPAYSITKDATSTDYAAVYHLTMDGTETGVAINIPKDMVVQSGSVVTNPEGQTAGTYIELVLANSDSTKIYIPVDGLIEYVTSGSASTDAIVIAVSDDHKVTATITDGSIAATKLSAAVQAQLAKVDALADGATKVEASETNGNIKIDGTEVTVYTHPTHTAYAAGLYKVTVDALGHVTAATAVAKADLDALIGTASASANGLMTSAQFSKLDGIKEGATVTAASTTNGNITINGTETTVYTHPAYTAADAAFVKVGRDVTGHVVVGDAVAKADLTGLIGEASTTEAGLLSTTDKTKLDGIEIATDTEVTNMLTEVFGA